MIAYRMVTALFGFVVYGALTSGVHAAASDDPLDSALWPEIFAMAFGESEHVAVVFDDAMRLMMPEVVEDAHQVPVMVKIPSDLGTVREFVLLAENNPIQMVTRAFPHRPIEAIGMNIRLEMSTPVRAAALTGDGVWHVSSVAVTVMAPGGCSIALPGAGDEVGEVALKTFDRVGGAGRAKVRILHPMHTGFATNDAGSLIPAFYVDRLEIADDDGPIVDMITWAAMASDPTIILDLPARRQSLRITASDSEGGLFEAYENAPSM